MGVKATEFGSILIEKHVGFRGELKWPEAFLPTKLVGDGSFGRNEADKFGTSVSIDGDLAVVGVPSQDYDENGEATIAEAGVVFVYRRTPTSWEFAYRISSPEGDRAADNFGYAVSLKGKTLIVGSPKNALNVAKANPVVGAGAAFIYSIGSESYEFQQKVVPANRDIDDNFGSTVTAQANIVFVGSYAHGRDDQELLDAPGAGAVWAYARTANPKVWVLQKKITAGGNERNAFDKFGQAVGAYKDTLVVGVPEYDFITKGTDKKDNAGTAYVFGWEEDHWEYRQTLFPEDREAGDLFGFSVSVFGDKIAIGAPGKNGNIGKVYQYTRDPATLLYTVSAEVEPTPFELPATYTPIVNPALVQNAKFGSSLSQNETHLVVGAPNQAALNVSNINTSVNPFTYTGTVIADAGFAYVYGVAVDGTLTLQNKFTGADRFGPVNARSEDGNFGLSVSMGAGIMVVGEPAATRTASGTDTQNNAGLAHVYVLNNDKYELSKTLEGFYVDRNIGDAFATDFASNDRFMVFTAPGQDYDANNENFLSNSGAAYVWEFVGGAWTFLQKIVPNDRTAGLGFGSKVAIVNDRIFVSAPDANSTGTTYAFQMQDGTFVQTQKLVVDGTPNGILFGSNLLAVDNRLFIASLKATVRSQTGHGAVWAYTLNSSTNTYVLDTMLVPTGAVNADSEFGSSMAVNDNVLVVGAPGHNLDKSDATPLTAAGAVFVFAKNNGVWSQIDKLAGPGNDRDSGDFMGYSVSGSGDTLAVGIPHSNLDLAQGSIMDNAGKVYLYRRVDGKWESAGGVVSPNRSIQGKFGFAVSLSDNLLAVSAIGEPAASFDSSTGVSHGRVYIFEKQYSDWILINTLENTEFVNQTGQRRFGYSIALEGNRLIVGEPGNSTDRNNATVLNNSGAAWIFERNGTSWTNYGKLTQELFSGRSAGALFGWSVDIKGDLAVVGAPYDRTNFAGIDPLTEAGSIHVFRRRETQGTVSWVAENKIAGIALERNAQDGLGSTVASNSRYVAVSALGHDFDTNRENFFEGAGAVFIYEWVNNALVFLQKVVGFDAGDRYTGAAFGTTLAMSETHLVVGSPNFNVDLNGNTTTRQFGKVWAFKLSNGIFIKDRSFRASNPKDVDPASNATPHFGYSISIDGTTLAIGAEGASYGASDTALTNAGFVDVYEYNGVAWSLKQTIQPDVRETTDRFGESVTVKGDTLVVGYTATNSSSPSISADGRNFSGGAVSIYIRKDSVWTIAHKVVRGQAERFDDDQFGFSVSVDGEYMAIGAPYMTMDADENEGQLNAGSVFLFKKDPYAGWIFSRKLNAPERKINANFGYSVALKNDKVIVGAPGEDAAYVFRRNTNSKIHKTRRTARFAATGATQSFVIPENVTKLTAYLWGASGAQYTSETSAGNGGFVRATFDVTGGETLTVNVGTKPTGAGAGGGRSEILRGSSTLMVAGGGGGAAAYSNYSTYTSNGGSAGENGYSGNPNTIPGRAGTASNGGSVATSDATNWWIGQAGSFKQGGNGTAGADATVFPGGWPNGGSSSLRNTVYGSAGGGDGWYGGSAGSVLKTRSGDGFVAPGGGGSSYVAPGIQGYMSTIKTEYEDHLQVLGSEVTRRPGVNSDGYILLEYFIETPTEDWELESRLVPTRLNTSRAMRFGYAVGYDGVSVAVSAPNYIYKKDGTLWTVANGVVSVFEYVGFEWNLVNNVFPFGVNGNHSANNGSYGFNLSIYGDFMVVGCPLGNHDAAGEQNIVDAGVAFAYHKENGVWKDLERIVPPGGARNLNDQIGTAIGYAGDWVAVGAPGHDFNDKNSNQVSDSGSVFMWKWDNGALKFAQKITAPAINRKIKASFGTFINMDSTSLIVSAPGVMLTETTMAVEGEVFEYILVDGTWVFNQRFAQPENLQSNAYFGGALARDGNKLAIAANGPLLSTVSLGLTTSLVYALSDTSLPSTSKVWSFEIRTSKGNTNNLEYAGSLNYADKTPGTFSIGSFGSATRVYGYDKNGNQVQLASTTSTTGALRTIVIKRTATNLLQVFIDGTQMYSQNATTAGFDIPVDFENGFRMDPFGTSRGVFAFARYSYEDVNATLNQGAEIGARPTSRFFVNYGIANEDLTNNYDVDTVVSSDAEPDFYFTADAAYDIPSENGGKVYIYDRADGKWTMSQVVRSWAQTSVTDHFGSSLSLKDGMLLVGAYGHSLDQSDVNPSAGAGAVFYFKADETGIYQKQQKIVAWGHDIVAGDLAGDVIVSNANTIAVAATGHPYDANGNNYLVGAGAIYIWRREGSSWVFEQKLSAPIRAANDAFGKNMALSGTTLVVGVPASSKAFVFEKTLGSIAINCWSAGVELVPIGLNASTPAGTLGFGYSVAVDATAKEVIVGAPGHQYDFTGQNPVVGAGAAFTFAKEGAVWVSKQKLTNTGFSLEVDYGKGRQVDDNFGWSVGLAGNVAIVGSPNYDYDSQGERLLNNTGAVVTFTRPSPANLWVQFQILTSQSDFREPNDYYGSAIASNNEYVAISTPGFNYDERGYNYKISSGIVAIWKITGTTWTLSQKITAGEFRKANAAFGFSMAMHGNTLLVSAPSTDNTMLGEVFEFTLNNGLYEFTSRIQDTVNNTSSAANQLLQAFGWAIDFDGTTLIVGNPVRSTSFYGQAHLFEKQNGVWTLLDNIRFETSGNNGVDNTTFGANNLGQSVSVNGNIAAVGAWDHDGSSDGLKRGAVLVWMKDNDVWSSSDKIVSQIQARESGEQFGFSISASGDFMAVGAPLSNHGALNRRANPAYGTGSPTTNSGVVIMFKKNEAGKYEFYQRISPRTGSLDYNGGDNFGYSVALVDDTLMAGAPNHAYDALQANPVTKAGAIFEFRLNEDGDWMQASKIVAQGYMARQPNDYFGQNIVLEGKTMAVGAGNHNYGKTSADTSGNDTGCVYVYRRIDGVWYFVDKAIGEEPNLSRRSGFAAGKGAMALKNGWLVTALNGAYLDSAGTDSITNAGGVMVHRIESLDSLQVKLLGSTYVQQAQTKINFHPTTGSYDGVGILVNGTGYTSAPEVLFSNEDFEGYAVMQPVGVQKIELTEFDSTVDEAPTVTIERGTYDTTGTGATAVLNRANPVIGAVTVTSPGGGYTSAPAVTISHSTGTVLQAVLQPSYVTELNLIESSGGYYEAPEVTFAMPISGETATGHAVMEIQYLALNQNSVSYVGEVLELDMIGTPAKLEVTSVDADRKILTFGIIDPGVYVSGSTLGIPAKSVNSEEDFGSITESSGTSQSEDYGTLFSMATTSQTDRGQVSAANTSTKDYGSVADANTSTVDNGRVLTKNVTSSEDYGLITGPVTASQDYNDVYVSTISYGKITEAVTSRIYRGSITGTSATFDATLNIKSLVLDTPGFGYRSIPKVSIQTIGLATASASAMIAPVGVDSVNIIEKGKINSNSVITFAGTNKPTATYITLPGAFESVTVTNGGSGYTRTPRVVFSNPAFKANAKLYPTGVDSVVTTKQDSSLTLIGNVKYKKYITEPNSIRRDAQLFGSAIAAAENTLVVGAPMTGSSTAQSSYNAGQVVVFETNVVKDRGNKINVDGYMDGSSVLDNITGDFTINMWFKNSLKTRAASFGTFFAGRNPGAGLKNSHLLWIDHIGTVRVAGTVGYDILGFVDPDTNWHNVTYKSEGSKVYVYWDGSLVGKTTRSEAEMDMLVLGAQFRNSDTTEPTGKAFRGYMADIAVWNAALTDEQILELLETSAREVAGSDLVALWAGN